MIESRKYRLDENVVQHFQITPLVLIFGLVSLPFVYALDEQLSIERWSLGLARKSPATSVI